MFVENLESLVLLIVFFAVLLRVLKGVRIGLSLFRDKNILIFSLLKPFTVSHVTATILFFTLITLTEVYFAWTFFDSVRTGDGVQAFVSILFSPAIMFLGYQLYKHYGYNFVENYKRHKNPDTPSEQTGQEVKSVEDFIIKKLNKPQAK